ncbi:pseudouridine synthase [Alkalilacustris brevis]|uniref:pseudouridine synthase n=1 Tax=Alkalilacustris brevis TaxID=2026338 RepID=UPI000E0DD8FD|nr:pseudouridine synthase [Alkalilacustris brevis]
MTDKTPEGDRIAKVLARAGAASRRGAEAMILQGRVAVNGRVIDSPALNVGPRDKVTLDGKPLAAPEPARLWLYHKPTGLVTSARDEKGRATVFDNLPEGLPRVMPVGRLDINSEGLLLLTNDGALKRALELPSTGWLRRYRVRVNGTPDEASVAPLREGITVEGEKFQPMLVSIDRQQGANAWLTVGIREGRNREVRRAMEAVGLVVNRLIRISYGPFQLGKLDAGAVEEVRPRVLREQIGERPGIDLPAPPAETPATGKPARRGKPAAKTSGKPLGKPGNRRNAESGQPMGAGGARGSKPGKPHGPGTAPRRGPAGAGSRRPTSPKRGPRDGKG